MWPAFLTGESRRPTDAEKNLIKDLLLKASLPEKVKAVDSLLVHPMNDGGMGSLYLFDEGSEPSASVSRKMRDQAAEVEKMDTDGVPVSIALNLDQYGDLYELDVWKVDFSPIGHQGIAGLVDRKSIDPQK